MNKTVTLKYIYDVITGVCTACFYTGDIEICKYSGTIAIDIPITASNRAQVEAGYITSAIGAIASLKTRNWLGVAGSAFGALMNQNHFKEVLVRHAMRSTNRKHLSLSTTLYIIRLRITHTITDTLVICL